MSVLVHYDPSAETRISADASSFGLGAVLLQKVEGQWKPVAYASRAMTETEQRYAQIVHYDPSAETRISADASSFGLGAVLLQKVEGQWKPVAYASRAMTETEQRYAQIEKEALAIVWACDKFSCYILEKHFEIETDHKPLVPLLGTKHLDTLPPRVLRFLARFDYHQSCTEKIIAHCRCPF